jgi:hypothetical protein
MKRKTKAEKENEILYGKNAVYGFCEHYRFPYIIGQILERPCEKNEGPGLGCWKKAMDNAYMKPDLVVPLESGKEIKKEIDKITVEYEKKKKELKEIYHEKVKKLFSS